MAFDILENMHDSAGLEALLDASGKKDFSNREEASLLAARSLLVNERTDVFGELREQWRGREQHALAWKEMDARLLNQRDRRQEVELQFGVNLAGTADEAGLMDQVAHAVRHRDVQQAQQALKQAVEKAPNHPEVWLELGRLHEQTNALKNAEQAYQQALMVSRRDPFTVHEVGEFYRRQARFDFALKVWSQALAHPSLHVLWIKCLFWRKTATAYPINWNGLSPPEGYLLPAIQALGQLGENEFWNAAAAQRIASTTPGLLERQEIYWLRLLDALLSGQETHALMLLNTQMFGENSWNPLLETALLRVLTYRRNGFITPMDCSMNMDPNLLKHSKLFNALVQWSRGSFQEEPTSLIALLQSNGIVVQLFADAGWTRAADILAGKSE